MTLFADVHVENSRKSSNQLLEKRNEASIKDTRLYPQYSSNWAAFGKEKFKYFIYSSSTKNITRNKYNKRHLIHLHV